MAASFVQIDRGSFGTSSASLAVALSSGVTAGNFVIVAGSFDSVATGVTLSNDKLDAVTDSGVGLVTDAGGTIKSFVKAFFAPTSGAITFTATYSGTNPTFGDLFVWEISGLSNPTFDKVVHANGTATATDSGSTGTLSSATEAGIAFGCSAVSFSASGSGWTTGQGSTVGTNLGDGIVATTSSLGEHRVIAATTAINGTGTASAGQWTMWAATVMTGAAAGSTVGSSSLVLPPLGNRRLELQQNRTWTWNGLEYTLADVIVSGAAPLTTGRKQLTDAPIGSKRDYPYFQRTWIQNHVENTLFSPGASQFLPPGKSLMDRPFVPTRPGLFWAENLLQSTLSSAPAADTNTYKPTPFDWQVTRATVTINWAQPPNLLPLSTTTVNAIPAAPFVPNQWLVLPAQIRIQPQPQPNQLPLGAPGAALFLPDGKAYTDRPYVGPYPGKTWIQQLLPQSQSEFIPTPVGVQYTNRPYVAPYSGKTWTQQLLPQSQSEFLPTPVGAQLTSRTLDPARPIQQTWTKNLLESTLDGAIATGGTPVGAQLTARPSQLPPRSGQTWLNNLLETTLDIQAITGSAAPVGKQFTDRPPVPVTSGKTWINNLLQNTLASIPVDTNTYTYKPTPFDWQVTPTVRGAIWNQPPNMALLSAPGAAAVTVSYKPTPFDWQLSYRPVRSALWDQPPNIALLSAPGPAPPTFSYKPTPFDWQVTYQPIRKALWDQPPNIALQNPEPFVLEPRAPYYAVRIVAGQFNRSFAQNTEALLFASLLQPDVPKNQFNWPLTPSVRAAIWDQRPTLLPLGTTGASQFLPVGVNYTARPPLGPVRSAIWNQLPTRLPLGTVGASQFMPDGKVFYDRPALRARPAAIWNQPPNMALTGAAGVSSQLHNLPFFATLGQMKSF